VSRREKISLIGEVISPIVATAAAGFTFWWLAKYSTICERDIVGTSIVVWCAVVARVLIWAEKSEEVVK
jgi:hypothetical protein